MITSKQAEQISWIIDCVEAQAKEAAVKPDAHNLMQLGGSLSSLRRAIDTITAKDEDTPAEDSDGWTEWGGGERPVERTVMVEVRFRNGEEHMSNMTHYYEWRHFNDGYDIIAYRILK